MSEVFPVNSGLTTTGSVQVDFGPLPGSDGASVVITGQANMVTASAVRGWLRMEATADHTADEHRVENLRVNCGDITPGVGFTVYVDCVEGLTWGVYNVSWGFT